MREGLIDENDDITKKGMEEAEKIIAEESEKLAATLPKKELTHCRSPSTKISFFILFFIYFFNILLAFKGYVEVILIGKTTPLQMTQIGTLINESRFVREMGSGG
jgi:hypothetical protein